MKRLEYIFIVFATILLTTSCGKDDLLPDGNTDAPAAGQTQTYTFTVSPDIVMEGDARTRSEETNAEMPNRCFMQILGNDVPSKVENGISTDEAQDVDVEFHLLKQTIQNISLAANSHITLQGDLSENGDKWTGTPDYYKQVFADAFFKEGKPFGKEINGTYYYWASDEANRRIINSILKTTAFGGE